MARETGLIPSGLRRGFERMRRARQQARTELALGSLPEYIRKDIGWPDGYAEQNGRNWR